MTILQDKTTKIAVITFTLLALLIVVAYTFMTYRWVRVAVLSSPLVWVWLQAVPVIWRDHVARYDLWREQEAEFRRNHPFLSALGIGVEKPMDPAAVVLCWLCLGTAIVFFIAMYLP